MRGKELIGYGIRKLITKLSSLFIRLLAKTAFACMLFVLPTDKRRKKRWVRNKKLITLLFLYWFLCHSSRTLSLAQKNKYKEKVRINWGTWTSTLLKYKVAPIGAHLDVKSEYVVKRIYSREIIITFVWLTT